MLETIGLGGGCHWCTEAVFESLKGVTQVNQGYIASIDPYTSFSEAIIIEFDPQIIALATLIEIHLHTHQSTKNHSRRDTYRSAVYFYTNQQKHQINTIMSNLQVKFEGKIITKIIQFNKFKASRAEIQHYYKKNPEKPFCKKYIIPKLLLLQDKFPTHV
ncbi:peptide-methionine (S)-S-oxide reductase [Aquimarina agarilytica]|uniref:peptide-methionine (S)-S-oxide reductase n=1 Tax=Aquimarina agarilytica TaxID=1087449 RepID=UPI0002887DD6|nr:peptide-methionine (S)-S-oxide reductase [Aquimarina agarilytica]